MTPETGQGLARVRRSLAALGRRGSAGVCRLRPGGHLDRRADAVDDRSAEVPAWCSRRSVRRDPTPLGLRPVESGIEAAGGEQGLVSALFHDLAVVEHEDAVGIGDRG